MFNMRDAGRLMEEYIQSHPFFEYYRIVDIETYTVYELKDGKLIPYKDKCYNIWNRDYACQNCISRLAVNENRQIIKLDMVDDKVFLVESMPLPDAGSTLALELIRDATDSLLVNDVNQKGNRALAEMIQRLNHLATHDSYTGLYNKHFIEHELQRQTIEWKETEPLVIVLLDIDRFKLINDTYGHLMGDQVILTLADKMKECTGQNNGWAGRVGGDEFIMVFRGMDIKEVNLLIEEFRKMVLGIEFRFLDQSCNISISIGSAGYGPNVGDWKSLYALADQAMYTNKQQQETCHIS